MKRANYLVGLIVIMLMSVSITSAQDFSPEVPPEVTLSEAFGIIETNYGTEAIITEVELEEGCWKFELITDGAESEVCVDALDGTVGAVADDEENEENEVEEIPIVTAAEAIASAQEVFPEFAIVSMEFEDDRSIWVILFEDGSSVESDSNSGEVLYFGSYRGEAEDGDNHDDDGKDDDGDDDDDNDHDDDDDDSDDDDD